jgi:pimeloyl-ACP methyl ester carboxylesterase
MRTFVLIHGAGDSAWFWHLVELDRVEITEEMSEEDAWTIAAFMHDVPSEIAADALKGVREQSETPGSEPWPMDAWPDVPTRFLLCRDDRFFPPEWLRKVVKDRLGITPDEIHGGHCVALSRPRELADRLHSYTS